MKCSAPPSPDDARAPRFVRADEFRPARAVPFFPGRRGCAVDRSGPHFTGRKVIRDRIILDNALFAGFLDTLRSRVHDALSLDSTVSVVVGPLARVYHRDRLTSNSSFTGGFMNPRRSHTRDTVATSPSLFSGAVTLTVIVAPDVEDRLLLDHTLDSGIYLSTVIFGDNDGDRMTLDPTLNSGVYTLVVIVTPDVEDRLTLGATLENGGAYTKTINNVPEETDRMTLTSGLNSGIYQ